MATQAMCNSFKTELFSCYHCFTAPTLTSGTRAADAFKIALYTSASTNSSTTTVYTTTNEITGTGYTAGGLTLSGVAVGSSGATSWVDWAGSPPSDPQWTGASFTANSALIYNSTQLNGTGRAVCVLTFGGDKTVTSGTFTIVFPNATASEALIRIG